MARTYLYCFPYAGGNSTFYRELGNHLKPSVSMKAIELKGHGARMGEEPDTRMAALLDDAYEQMSEARRGERFALLGYSMGATAIYHLYFYLKERGLKPNHLFFMANVPPYVTDDSIPSYKKPDKEFLDEMVELGGISEEVLACQELVDLILPMLKADVELEETSHVDAPETIDCNMTVIYSDSDDATGQMDEWRRCAGRLCQFHKFEGSHFFMWDHYEDVAAIVNRRI